MNRKKKEEEGEEEEEELFQLARQAPSGSVSFSSSFSSLNFKYKCMGIGIPILSYLLAKIDDYRYAVSGAGEGERKVI